MAELQNSNPPPPLLLKLTSPDGIVSPVETLGISETWDLVRELDPATVASLVLQGEGMALHVWPRCRADEDQCVQGLACVRLVRGQRTLWLGREREGPRFELEGRSLPAGVEVPLLWTQGVVQGLIRGAEVPAYYPWYDDDFQPLSSWRADLFHYQQFAEAEEALPGRLAQLKEVLESKLKASADPQEAMAELISELRRVGHDLWSVSGFDGESECWDLDYMRWAPGQGLCLEVWYIPQIRVELTFEKGRSAIS